MVGIVGIGVEQFETGLKLDLAGHFLFPEFRNTLLNFRTVCEGRSIGRGWSVTGKLIAFGLGVIVGEEAGKNLPLVLAEFRHR